jgi:hemolysin activation/secretion protein
VPTKGWTVRGNLAGYPAALGLPGAFATANAMGATYVPLGIAGLNLALRAGGGWAGGDFPAQYAPTIGGSSTLRGYRSKRFAGDVAANAGAELRLPIGELNFLVRSKVGVLGLADAGRVWYDGHSVGDWHTGVGGGVYLTALGRVVSVTYAKGEHHRFYLKGGLGF